MLLGGAERRHENNWRQAVDRKPRNTSRLFMFSMYKSVRMTSNHRHRPTSGEQHVLEVEKLWLPYWGRTKQAACHLLLAAACKIA